MIFYLLYNSLSKQIYNYANGFKSDELAVYMLPEDVIEIKMSKDSGAFFSQFGKSIYLDIDLIKSNGKVVTYGPFDRYDHLQGFTSKDSSYILRFTNEGEFSLMLSIIFANGSYPNVDDFQNSDLFPFFENIYKGQIVNGIQFYYKEKDKDGLIPIYINLVFFGIFFFVLCYWNCINCLG